jgi:Bifunctional DNA primase/polymerase, N-terminal
VTGRGPERPSDAAHRYADAGWPVFPLQPGSKVPYPRTHGLHDATADPDKAAWLFEKRPAESNVGIATGAPGPDVVDVDHHGERGNGFAAFNEAKRAGLVNAPQAMVRTPSGGWHAYFKGTDQQSGKIPARHLDFRAQGGYVVAPPSQVGGRPYAVVSKQASAATVDWHAIRDLVDPQPLRTGRQLSLPEGRPRSLDHLARHVAGLQEGNRSDGTFWALCRAAEAGDRDAMAAIAEAARSTGLTEREIAASIRSAERTAARGAEPRPFARPPERQLEAG